jgi:hypothetical protein
VVNAGGDTADVCLVDDVDGDTDNHTGCTRDYHINTNDSGPAQ